MVKGHHNHIKIWFKNESRVKKEDIKRLGHTHYRPAAVWGSASEY